MKWLPSNNGFTYYLVSAVSEWILSIAFCIFVLSFYGDLKMLGVSPPKVTVSMLLRLLLINLTICLELLLSAPIRRLIYNSEVIVKRAIYYLN